MTKTEEQIRSEFESWYVPEDDRYREQCLQRNKDGNYIVKGVYDAWGTWQACQRQNDAEIARLREGVKEAVLGLRKIEYVYGDERVGELAKIYIDNTTKALGQGK
jgi:hypothetical protein